MSITKATSKTPSWRAGTLAVFVAVVSALMIPAIASAYTEYYGQYNICGSNCYVQSGAAHTFYVNGGSALGGSYLACQLFQQSGTVNVVGHDYGTCSVTYGGGQYVWARVYNQSGVTDYVTGLALA